MSVSQKVPVATLGVPRIGRRRELKFALESYWSGKSTADELLETARALRAAHWQEQRDKGVDRIPSNDFSLYDHVLDTAVMVVAIPDAYRWARAAVPAIGVGDGTAPHPGSAHMGVEREIRRR